MAEANASISAGEESAGEVSAGEEYTEHFDFIHDLNYPNIVVHRIKHSEFAKNPMKLRKSHRWYNALHACPFGCECLRTNFSVHVKSVMHAKEPEAKEIKQANPEESRRLICLLWIKANHEHNKKVVAKKKGEILLARKDFKAIIFLILKIMDHGPTALSGCHCPS